MPIFRRPHLPTAKKGAGGTLIGFRRRVQSRPHVSRILFDRADARSCDHFSGPIVANRLKQPTRGCIGLRRCALWPGLSAYLALLPVGFALPPESPPARCALTAPFHPYRKTALRPSPGGIFSVALSVGLLRLDVIKHRALQGGLHRFWAVRTFLIPETRDAIAASAAIYMSIIGKVMFGAIRL
jgi:hypothetical protein